MAGPAPWFETRKRKFAHMPDYFTAIARQWQDILWGASLPAVGIIVWWALGSPPKWLTAVYFVVVMFIAGYFVWLPVHLRLIPKLGIRQVHIQTTPCQIGRSIWVQLEPKCLTDSDVEQCQGHLIRILFKDPASSGMGNREWEPTEMNEPLILGWSYGDHSPVTLHPGVPRRINVFSVYSEEPRIIKPCVEPLPLRAFDVLSRRGSFRFEIELTAKDCQPVDVAVEYERGTPWDKPVVRMSSIKHP